MLDHAIESAVKVPEPERRCIDLLVCTRQSFVVVNVISPDRPVESADTRAAHYAVKVTNRIVQKYKGTLTTESQNGFFCGEDHFSERPLVKALPLGELARERLRGKAAAREHSAQRCSPSAKGFCSSLYRDSFTTGLPSPSMQALPPLPKGEAFCCPASFHLALVVSNCL